MKRNKFLMSLPGYAFIAPAFAVIFIFTICSIIAALIMMFFVVDLSDMSAWKFVGLGNFTAVLQNDQFKAALYNTVKYVIIVVPLQTVISLLLASMLNSKIRFKRFFASVYFLPTLTSSAAMTMIFMWLFNPTTGILSQVFGVSLDSAHPEFALSIIMAMNIFSTVPYFMVIYLAGLQDISPSLYEAAKLDGAGAVRRFLSITVPQIKPISFFVITMGVIGCFQVFDQVYIISGGAPQDEYITLSYLVYKFAFTDDKMGRAAALAVILAIIIFTVQFIIDRFMKADEVND